MLFRDTFAVLENARSSFQHNLPAPMVGALDWSILRLEPSSFINPELAASESDLLFQVRLGRTAAAVATLPELQRPRTRPRALSGTSRNA